MGSALIIIAAACGGDSSTTSTLPTTPAPDPASTTAITNAAPPSTSTTTTVTPPTTTAPDLSICEREFERTTTGTIASDDLVEISGLVASRSQPGVLWVHNDSGDDARVYAVSTMGDDLGSFLLSDLEAGDWEDIAISSGPEGGDHLYLADIGDNDEDRDEIVVYRIPEPILGSASSADGGEELTLTYPDSPHDAETLLIDPIANDLIIVTKEFDGQARVFGISGSTPWNSSAELEDLGSFDLGFLNEATGGDVSASGETIVVRTYGAAYGWPRAPGSTLAEALMSEPCRIASLPDLQGEAIGFGSRETEFFTVSEGEGQPLHLFTG